MRYFSLLFLLIVFLVTCVSGVCAQNLEVNAATAITQGITPQMVREAIQGGIEYLRRTQSYQGSWREENPEVHQGGVSALCALALLNAGVPPEDPCMVKALDYLRKIDPTTGGVTSIYVASLQLMVFCAADPKKDRNLIQRNALWIQRMQKKTGEKSGAWGYPDGFGDPSNSQFALLGLYEAQRVGVAVNPEIWRNTIRYWRMTQNVDGSWPYNYLPPAVGKQAPGTGSMTCAGLVSMLIASQKSQLADARIHGDSVIECMRQDSPDAKRINHAFRWLTERFSVSRNPGNREWFFYYLYGLERVGRMTGNRYLGDHDWYREGVAELLRLKISAIKGNRYVTYWKGTATSELMEVISTSFALLFLSKGRWPTLIGKVQYGSKDDWNQHRHDVNHLTRYVETQWHQNLTWQCIRLDTASVDDLLQVPVLYFCGTESPLPESAEKQRVYAKKLRDYLDRGGFILAEGICKSSQFDAGFKRLIQLMFPENDYLLNPIRPEHPIWRTEKLINPNYLRPLMSVDYGCRTCVVFIPSSGNPRPSLSGVWEVSEELKRTDTDSPAISNLARAEVMAGLDMSVNILAYATNRQLKTKEENFITPVTDTEIPREVKRGRLEVANLRHPGGCEIAPKALGNILRKTAAEMNLRAGVSDKTIPITSMELYDYPVVFMQGRNTFQLTEDERKALRTYFLRGGMLFANSICASKEFNASFLSEMKEILPADVRLVRIPYDDPLLSTQYGGSDLSRVKIHEPGKVALGSITDVAAVSKSQEKTVRPELYGAKINGRYVIIYSPLDISCAMERHGTLECRGYVTQDAARIAINILLYAMQN